MPNIIDEITPLEDWGKAIIEENIKNARYNKGHIGAQGFNEKENIFLLHGLFWTRWAGSK